MLSFENDYSEGAHSRILKRLVSTDLQQVTGYGNDPFCEEARIRIRQAIGVPDADIYFLSGGTQTNQVVIDTMLKPYEGVIAAETGHVSVHEAGAIEYSGHKVLTVPMHNGGKVNPMEVKNLIEDFYLEGLDRQIRKTDENPSVGLLLCASKNDEVVEYTMSRTLSPMMMAQYQLQLPDKNILRKKLQELANLPEIEETTGGSDNA